MIVFFGTYLSKFNGTKGPSEFIASELGNADYVRLVSKSKQPLIRLYQSLVVALFQKMELAVLDVYSTRVIYQTAIVAAILKIRKIKYVSVLHGGGLIQAFPNRRKIITYLLQQSAQVVTPSKMLQSFFKAQKFNIDYLPNPIQHRLFPYKQRDFISNSPKLLWVRAFGEIYQPTIAIEALHHLHQQQMNATLTMVGPDLGLMAKMRILVEQLGLTKFVSFVGQCPQDQLYTYMHQSDLLLNTTKYESFGLAVAEAAATGLPCISTKVGELPNIWIDNVSIFFVEATPVAFSKKIIEICSNNQMYLKTTSNCYQNSQLFASSSIIANWKNITTTLKHN
ncbi:MAG: glycosyltransferase [Bacteroidia bacterium]|jgi:glycosyltransferase involved in cell wall biosynthesis|nr:glycosyltransferase [Bacteroidia bacterium]